MLNKNIPLDKSLSWKAKGILSYAFCRPDDWQFYLSDLVNYAPDGRDAVSSGLKELERAGYLHRSQKRYNGKFSNAEWTFFEEPTTKEEANKLLSHDEPTPKCALKKSSPSTENPFTSQSTENPLTETPRLLSKENTKYKEKEKNIKKEKQKTTFGQYGHVKLTQTEYDNLLQDFGEEKLLYWIKQVDEWCEENGNSKKNYSVTISKWAAKAPNQHKEKANPKEGKNKASAEKCKKNLQGQAQKQGYEIEVLNDRIKIKQTNGNNNDFVLNYSEEGFHEQLVNQLRKLKII